MSRAVASLALILALAPAAAASAIEEHRLKAAFVFNFTQFVTWPGDEAELIVAVYGSDEVAAALEETVRGRSVEGRPLAVRRVRTTRDLPPCAVLFVGAMNRRQVAEALAAVRAAPVLTVGEGDEFLRRGGMIALVLRERRLRFIVDAAAARRAGLRISSRLLSLAEQVVE